MLVHEKKLLVYTMAALRMEVNLRVVLTVDRGRLVANVELIEVDENNGGQPEDRDQNDQNENRQYPERANRGQNPNLCNCNCCN